MNLVAVCISRQPVESDNGWPFYNLAEDIELSTRNPYRYTKALADKRNRAVAQAIEKYPDSDHVLMCDSYYVGQFHQLERLVHDYSWERMEDRVILGGAIWGRIVTKIQEYFKRKPCLEWFDRWAVPELAETEYSIEMPDFVQVSSVGGVNIFPRKLWDDGIRYGACEDLHGCEHNFFCEQTEMPKLIDLRASFRRERVYPFTKCLRCSLHLGRLIGR